MELRVLGKNELKELAKQQRGAQAKQVKESATMYQPSDVVFQAPVRVTPDDPDYNKLQNKLGNYEVATQLMQMTKTLDLVGIERQPPTPQPSKVAPGEFFKSDNTRGKNLFPGSRTTNHRHYPGSDQRSQQGPDHRPKYEEKDKQKTFPKLESTIRDMKKATHSNAPSKGHNKEGVHKGKSSHSHQTGGKTDGSSSIGTSESFSSSAHRVDASGSRRLSSGDDSHGKRSRTSSSPSPRKTVKNTETANQSVKKESVSQSAKHQPINREPVLESLSHELDIDQLQSSSHSNPNPKRQPVDPSTILKDNRNGIVNGLKNRPMLHIPEKNVDDILKEMTRLSQPLTAIQTPIKVEGKFPFQVTDKVLPQQVKGLNHNSGEVKDSKVAVPNKKLEVPSKTVEDHHKHTADSDSDEDGDIYSAEEGSDDEEMKLSDADEPKDTTVHRASPSPVSRGQRGAKAPVKKPRSPMLTTDSSGSSSDGSSSSDSDSDNDGSDDDAEHLHHNNNNNVASPVTKPKSSPEDLDMSPSPSSQKKWNLSNYLKPEEHDSFMHLVNSKPPSLEAPSSNRSDKSEVDDVVLCVQPARGADQVISDDNPPSDKVPDDHDVNFSKPMSPNEFSPPGSYNKQGVIAPVKSPTNSTRRAYHKPSAAEKLQKNLKPNADILQTNTYDAIKSRKRSTVLKSPETNTSSKSPKVLEQTSTPNKRGRKKQKQKSVAIVSTSSESESDIDVMNASTSSTHIGAESPRKYFARSPKKSHHVQSAKSPISTKPTFIAKKKESKSEKHLKEEDSVKLKTDAKKSSNICDISIIVSDIHKDTSLSNKHIPTLAIKQEPDSIENILSTLKPPEPLLSPIPNEPVRTKPPGRTKDPIHVHHKSEMPHIPDKTKSVPKKTNPLNVSVSISNGKPSVMVHLNLELLGKLLYFDKNKLKHDSPTMEKLSNKPLAKGSEYFSQSKSSTPETTQSTDTAKLTSAKYGNSDKPEKVDNCDKSHILPSPHKNSASDVCNKSSEKPGANSANHKNSPSGTRTSKSVGKSIHVQKVLNLDKSDPVPSRDFDSLQRKSRRPLECLTDSDISESSTDCESDDEAKTRTKLLSPIRDSATTCLAISPDKKRKSDSHRAEDSKRRRTLTRSPHQKLTPQLEETRSLDDDREWNNKRPAKSKEQFSDGSSSHPSSHGPSQQSLHSESRHKRTRVEPSSDLKSSSDTTRTSPSPSSRHPGKPAPETVQANGHAHLARVSPHRQPSPTARRHGSWYPHCKEVELLQRSDVYHKQAKEFKHEADGLDGGLQKRVLYIEAVLCFIQCGCAMEKDRLATDSATMFKETHRFVVHGCHCRPHHHENSAELKLSVLCMRIQSLLFLKLFQLKKVETLKLKRILEDHNNKSLKQSSAQPKPPPSAPSPHQTNWNRSTGTPSPMSPTPSPSPAGSVGSIGSVGSANDMGTPSKASNGSTPTVVGSSIAVPQRIHSITQKYFTSTNYLLMCHDLWEQADVAITDSVRDYFTQLDVSCGQLTMQSSLLHLIHYVRQGLQPLKVK